jgi:hypothetical protein
MNPERTREEKNGRKGGETSILPFKNRRKTSYHFFILPNGPVFRASLPYVQRLSTMGGKK